MEELIPHIADKLDLAPSTLVFAILCVSTAGNVIGRLIPDDKTGPLGVIRDIAKLLGGYVQNRVSKGVKTGDVVKYVVDREKDQEAEFHDAMPELPFDSKPTAPPPVKAFPGLAKPKESFDDFPKEF